MDFASRWTAASLVGVGRSIQRTKSSTGLFVDVNPQSIQLTLTVLQPWSRKGMRRCGADIEPVERLVDRRSNGDGHHG